MLEMEVVYPYIFPGKKYNNKIMKNLMSELLKLGEDYLGIENFRSNPVDEYYYVLKELLNKKLDKNFDEVITKTERILKTSLISEEYYYYKLNILSLKRTFEHRKHNRMEMMSDIKFLIEPLITFFCMYFFTINYIEKNKQLDYNLKTEFLDEIKLISAIMEYVNTKSYQSEHVIKIYYNMFMSIYNSEDNRYFNELRILINKYKNDFSENEMHNFHIVLHAYCSNKLNLGNWEYLKIKFEIDKEELERKRFKKSSSITILPLEYKNLVKSGIGAREHDWTLIFIEEYKNKLTTGFDLNLYNYCLALTYFRMKEIKKALEHLSMVNYENVYDKLDVRCLLLQLYYESNAVEELDSQIESFIKFLNNDKIINKDRKAPIYTFVDSIKKLLKYKLNIIDEYQMEEFKKSMHGTVIIDKTWFLEKIDELIQNKI